MSSAHITNQEHHWLSCSASQPITADIYRSIVCATYTR